MPRMLRPRAALQVIASPLRGAREPLGRNEPAKVAAIGHAGLARCQVVARSGLTVPPGRLDSPVPIAHFAYSRVGWPRRWQGSREFSREVG
jgi:hypothetical protein